MANIEISVLDVDFLSNNILYNPDIQTDYIGDGSLTAAKRIKLDPVLKERFIERVLGDFWHSDKDQLDHFQFFSTGRYRCQRRKLKYDFATESSYWDTYQFKGASADQARELSEKFKTFYDALLVVREEKIYEKIDAIEDSTIYWQQRFMKTKRQKNDLLNMSDWRVLPDVPDSYEGEKAQWIAWRDHVRTKVLKSPDEFETNLAWFRYTYDVKYPVDPKIYMNMYPNGMLEDGVTPAPAFMDENDPNQWVTHDIAASSDFASSREQNMYNFSGQYRSQYKKIKQNVLDIMKLLNVEDVVPIDWSLYYVNDNEIGSGS